MYLKCMYVKHAIMFSVCVFFRSLFQNSSAVKNDVFHLSIQDVGAIGQILDYMYTSHLELNADNAHTLLHTAQSLQVIVVSCVPKMHGCIYIVSFNNSRNKIMHFVGD